MARNKRAPSLSEARIAFVRAYRAAHPKLHPDRARAIANRLFASEQGRQSLPRGLRSAHGKTYPKQYPRFTKALIEFGVPRSKAVAASKRFRKINEAHYKNRDRLRKIRAAWDPDAPYGGLTAETIRRNEDLFAPDIMTGELEPILPEQEEADWFDDFNEFYDDLMEDYGFDLHEHYKEEA